VRRPFPQRAENIGIWYYIIQSIAYSGIVTNVAIMIFTAHVFDTDLTNKWLIFIYIEHGLFLFKFLLSQIIPDRPYLVDQGLKWQKRVLNERMYNKLSDTDKEREARGLKFVNPGTKIYTFAKDAIPDDNELS
jgi:hypothetical protein